MGPGVREAEYCTYVQEVKGLFSRGCEWGLVPRPSVQDQGLNPVGRPRWARAGGFETCRRPTWDVEGVDTLLKEPANQRAKSWVFSIAISWHRDCSGIDIRGPGPFGPAREAAGQLSRGRHRYRGPVSGLGGLPRQLARTERLRGPRSGCSSDRWAWWGPSPSEVEPTSLFLRYLRPARPRPFARPTMSRSSKWTPDGAGRLSVDATCGRQAPL